jgi:hypothetical protein
MCSGHAGHALYHIAWRPAIPPACRSRRRLRERFANGVVVAAIVGMLYFAWVPRIFVPPRANAVTATPKTLI